MNKFERLTRASNEAARQALEDCTAKIRMLTDSQCNDLMEELKRSAADKAEIDKLQRKIQTATNKNKVLIEVIHKSQHICQSITGIIDKIV